MATYRRRKGKWQVQVRKTGHPPMSKTFATKGEGQRWAKRQEESIDQGLTPPGDAQRVTLSELMPLYLDELPQRHLRTEDKQRAMLVEWETLLGAYSLTAITTSLLSDTRNQLLKSIGPATVNRKLTALSMFFKWCINERELIDRNPVTRVKKPVEPRGRVRYLSDDERRRLFAAAKASRNRNLYPLVVVACYSGMRQSELLALTWSDVNLVEGWAIVRDSKNKEARQVPVRGIALDVLREHNRVRRIDSNQVFKAKCFPKWAWDAALDRAGIDNFRFHDLRHTAASYLAQNGATLVDIATILGHKTLVMAQRYSHLSPQRTASVMDSMVEAFG